MTLSSMRLVALIFIGLALAQTGPCSAQTLDQKPDQKPAATTPSQTVPEDTAPGRSGSSQEPLGMKLNRTDGVLHPPQGTDPGVAIPPPGTPGGNPAVEPK
jgi:hypothetical protein